MWARIKAFFKKHPIIGNIILICLTALILGWCLMFFLDIWTRHGSTARVPNVCNIDSKAAVRALEAAGFTAEISDSTYDQRYSPGQVISTWPRAGAVVKPSREVYITIASYETQMVEVTMPLVNVSSRQALNYLENQLKIKNVQIVNVPSQYPDLVLGATYNGVKINPGMRLPINAKVVLEVGIAIEPSSEESDSTSTGDHSDYDHYYDDDTSTSAVYD